MKIMLFITFNAFNLTLFLLSALLVNRFYFKDLSEHESATATPRTRRKRCWGEGFSLPVCESSHTVICKNKKY